MSDIGFKNALIVGAGSGLSASLARVLATEGIKVALAARSTEDLEGLGKEIGASSFACDASRRTDVEALFRALDASPGAPGIVIYNASFRTRGPLVDLDSKTIGINIARAGRVETYALPAETILALLPDLKAGKFAPKETLVKVESDEVKKAREALKQAEAEFVDAQKKSEELKKKLEEARKALEKAEAESNKK